MIKQHRHPITSICLLTISCLDRLNSQNSGRFFNRKLFAATLHKSMNAVKTSSCVFALVVGGPLVSFGFSTSAMAAGNNTVCDLSVTSGNLAGNPGDFNAACGIGNQVYGYYPNSSTEQLNSSAFGIQNQAKDSKNSTAVGYSNRANGVFSGTAVGSTNNVLGNSSSAIGTSNTAYGQSTNAMGTNNTIGDVSDPSIAAYSSAFGNFNTIAGPSGSNSPQDGSTAIGAINKINGQKNTAIGTGNNIGDTGGAAFSRSFAAGYQSSVFGDSSIAIGDRAAVGDNVTTVSQGVAIGSQATAMALGATALGSFASANAANSVAVGLATADGIASTAIGDEAIAAGNYSNAMGYKAEADGAGSVAIGRQAFTTLHDQVALGSSSQAIGVHTGNYTINGAAVSGVPSDTNGLVSVGRQGHERQIQYVAAGVVSASSTDAVNGSQLYAVGSQVNIVQGQVNNVQGQVNNVQNQVSTLGGAVMGVQNQMYGIRGRAYEGTAAAFAAVPGYLPENRKFGIAAHYGNYMGRSAIGGSAMIRANENVVVDIGLGVGTGLGSVGGRAGATFVW